MLYPDYCLGSLLWPIFPNYSGPQQCLEGSLLWQEFLGDQFLKNGISEANSYKYYKYYKRFQTKIGVRIRFQLSPIEILT